MRVPAILIAGLVVALSVTSCSKKEDSAQKQEPDVLVAKSTGNVDDQLAVKTAEKLTEQFASNLQKRLAEAIEENGPAGSIGVCGAEAASLKRTLQGGGWTIKRVSQRYRNSDNRADTLESQILSRFAKDSTKKYMSSWEVHEPEKTYMYYKPIYVSELCMNCHGDPQTMDPKVVAAIANKYPADQAIGYKVGDLRGMFVVTGTWPTARVRAEEMAKQ